MILLLDLKGWVKSHEGNKKWKPFQPEETTEAWSENHHHTKSRQYYRGKHTRGDVVGKGFFYTHDWKKRKKERPEGERERRERSGRQLSEALPSSTSVSVAFTSFSRLRFGENDVCLRLTSWKVVGLGFHRGPFDFKAHAHFLLPLSTAGISGHLPKQDY